MFRSDCPASLSAALTAPSELSGELPTTSMIFVTAIRAPFALSCAEPTPACSVPRDGGKRGGEERLPRPVEGLARGACGNGRRARPPVLAVAAVVHHQRQSELEARVLGTGVHAVRGRPERLRERVDRLLHARLAARRRVRRALHPHLD